MGPTLVATCIMFETAQIATSPNGRTWWGEVITTDMLRRARERCAAAWNARHGASDAR